MTIEEMIAVLEAAKRGEKVERGIGKTWASIDNPESHPFNFYEYKYRIAPKPEPKLVAHYPVVFKAGKYWKFLSHLKHEGHTLGKDEYLVTKYPPIMLPVEEE